MDKYNYMDNYTVKVSQAGMGITVYLSKPNTKGEIVLIDTFNAAYDQNGHPLEKFVLTLAHRVMELETQLANNSLH